MRLLLLLLSTINLCYCDETNLKFTIATLWDGTSLNESDQVTITIDDHVGSRDLEVQITAPFYGDPEPEVGADKPIFGLWHLEVVELYFLNDQDQYLQIQFGPHGHYLVMLLDGERNYVRHSLPLTVSTKINGDKWVANTVIPAAYLPTQVTRFNAYAMHGEADSRVTSALYHTDGTLMEPDNHSLGLFGAINLGFLSPQHKTAPASLLWQTAVAGIIPFVFDRDWKNEVTGLSPTVVTLQGFKGGVEMNYTVPQNVPKLQYKRLVIIFENSANESMKIILNADESYEVYLLLNKDQILTGRKLDIDSISEDQETSFTGSILIPPGYFPGNVKEFNVYSVFGEGEDQIEVVLQPITDGPENWKLNKTEIESSDHFIPIDIDFLIEDNSIESELWNERIAAESTRVTTTAPKVTQPVNLRSATTETTTTTIKPVKKITRKPSRPNTRKPTRRRPVTTRIGVWNPFEKRFPQRRNPPRPGIGLTGPLRRRPNPFLRSPAYYTQRFRAGLGHRSLDDELKSNVNILDSKITNKNEEKLNKPSEGFDENLEYDKHSISLADFLFEDIPESEIPLLSLTIESDPTTEPSVIETLPTFEDEILTTESTITFVEPITIPDDSNTEPPIDISDLLETVTEHSLDDGRVKTEEDVNSELLEILSMLSLSSKDREIKQGDETQKAQEHSKDSDHLVSLDDLAPSNKDTDLLETNLAFLDRLFSQQPGPVEDPLIEDPSKDTEIKQGEETQKAQEHSKDSDHLVILDDLAPSDKDTDLLETNLAFLDRLFSQQPGPVEDPLIEEPKIEEPKSIIVPIVHESPKQSITLPFGLTLDGFTQPKRKPLGPWKGINQPSSPAEPPYHPVCSDTGLVANPSRCQVFHECVIEEGKWVMYNWRCKRGRKFDPDQVACVSGIC